MLWDPGSVEKDEEARHDNSPVTPILVPLQNTPPAVEKNVPVLVPDVKDLKDQFQQQQNMLTQIKETLIQNESQLSSKGKQVEVYANKLSQIRARSKNAQAKKSTGGGHPNSPKMQKKLSKENLTKVEMSEGEKSSSGINSKNRKGKVSELKKCLEENKIKFQQRTGKEQSEAKKIEILVEHLKLQLEERDKTILDLQKTIEEPMPEPETLPKHKTKLRESVASKTTQTSRNQPTEDSIEIIALQSRIRELEANVLDLEENLKEKESVIEARTQAVTLLSQDLSLKGKSTLESLEETRQEMRTMQTNFIEIEDQLKKDLLERDDRLQKLGDKCRKLESTNFELSLKNAEQQEKLVNLQAKYLEADAERKSLRESTVQGQPDDKLDELTKKINVLTKELDDRNKAMIKMKIEHKNKVKNLNKTVDTLKGTSDEKAEIVRLRSLLEEFENVKTGLENRVAELEDEKDSEKKLKDQINELEIIIKKQNEELALHLKTITGLEKDNLDLVESNRDKSIQIENLQTRLLAMEPLDEGSEESRSRELSQRLESMEAEYSRKMEELRREHRKEMETLESYYCARGDGLDRRALEEYRISSEMNNIHVEEQIELLIREKQQLLEKLKSLSGVSSTDSLTFEKMEHSDLRDGRDSCFPLGEEVDVTTLPSPVNRTFHLEKIVNDQQHQINDLQKTITAEKEKVETYQKRISELERTIVELEGVNTALRQQMEMSEAGESGKSTKSNTNTKNRLKKIEMELTQSKKTVQEQSEKLNDLSEKLREKEELIQKYTEKIESMEKDEWDQGRGWKSAEDDIESVQELQKKCLSLENSLLELNEDCERLRKENIEVVHLLSEEKVKRRKLLEELEAKPEVRDAQTQNGKPDVEESVKAMSQAIRELEEKIERIESSHAHQEEDDDSRQPWEVADLQEKLEWTNVVLTSKETEIFRLQNLLEDRNSLVEVLEMDLKETKKQLEEKEKRLGEIVEELKAKEIQMREISANFDKLQESLEVANRKTATNETQLQELLATVKEMEGDVFEKESELQEIKRILAEKNLDMTNLRNRLEEVNSDLTYSYQEHLENMGKCLRDKESDYDVLQSEKTHLEEVTRNLVKDKEDLYNEKLEMVNERDRLKNSLLEKEKLIAELSEKLESVQKGGNAKPKSEEMEEMKIKMKKLAANLKKKAQNEADLMKQVKELEGVVSEKETKAEGLKSQVKEVTEKWETEKSEKEKVARELATALAEKLGLEQERAALKNQVAELEKELEAFRIAHDNQMKELGGQIQMLEEACRRFQAVEQEDKGKIAHLEGKTAELCQLYENAASSGLQNQQEVEKERGVLLQKLAEITGKHEELKFNHEQLLLANSELGKRLEDLQKTHEDSLAERSSLEAKIQENLAVVESLEAELKKTQDQMKVVEEKFFHSEDRRLSLENKNEEMCKKIIENSENLIAIDDLSIRVDELLKSEKSLQNSVKKLESNNAELKQALDQVQTEKYSLEKELKGSTDKMAEMAGELKELKNSDGEKSNLIRELTMEAERLKAENKQISSEFERLNRDYEQFEVDFKENLENSQNVEKSLRHRIEELLGENASLTEKCNLLAEDKHDEAKPEGGEEEKKRKKRKSVTFRTDEVEYIKDLKNQLHAYDANLKQANAEIENLKGELFRERLRHEVSVVVTEAQEKVESLRSIPDKRQQQQQVIVEPTVERVEKTVLAESPKERKFDANAFFGNDAEDPFLEVKSADSQQSSEFDSLMWDDGWGSEGNLEAEYLSAKVIESEKGSEYELKVKTLESEIKGLQEENERLTKELQEQTTKYAKAIRKLKEVKAAHDRLQGEVNKLKNSSGFGDLDAAIVDELKSQIDSMEAKEKELLKNLENAKLEKENLLKRIDVLNSGNEKFLEMKERQDNEVEIWQRKNAELLKEITDLRHQLRNPETRDESALSREVQELRNKVEALEWTNCELTELLEEKQEQLEGSAPTSDVEKVMKEKSQLQKEIEELNNVRELLEKKLFDEEKKNTMTIGELNEQLTALATENETLQDILGEMKNSADAAKKDKKQGSKIFDYFKSSPGDDLFPVAVSPKESSSTQQQEMAAQKITEMEVLIKQKEEQLKESSNEVETLRLRLCDSENAIRLKDEELNHLKIEKEKEKLVKESREIGQEVEGLRQRLLDAENVIRFRDEQLSHLEKEKEVQVKNSQDRNKELESLQQRLSDAENAIRVREEQLNHLRIEKENEMSSMRQTIAELENLIRLKDAENAQVRQAIEKEKESMAQKLREVENAAKLKEQFETIDLNEPSSAFPDDERALLRQRVIDLESLLSQRDEELERMLQAKTNEVEGLRQKVFELEDLARLREEELSRLQSMGNDVASLRRKIQELEEFSRFKENEFYQVQSMKDGEIQSLSQRILELENTLKGGPDQQRMFDLENMLRFKEEETRHKSMEIETLGKRVADLESEIPTKDEEIARLLGRLNELEKSYSDSKLEIERLLNEEKLNVEEKFVEPFQENMKIPVAFEVEAMTRTLEEEKQKSENLQYELSEKESLLTAKDGEIQNLNSKLVEMKEKIIGFQQEDTRRGVLTEESYQMKAQLEKMISDLQKELENSNLQLSVTRRELEEFQNVKNEMMTSLKSQILELETELTETRERERTELAELRSELAEKTKYYEGMIKERREEEEKTKQLLETLEKSKKALEKDVEMLKFELEKKGKEVEALAGALAEERSRAEGLVEVLRGREAEVADLRETLAHLQDEIGHFRNFEKQVKELRVEQMKEAGAEVPVTAQGHPDLSDWTEHELAELSARLQSDLDTALYMLHQRDVRCDELTFELMQLLEERDTLQLRLSTALRINEELRALNKPATTGSTRGLEESKDLVDQSNDRQADQGRVPGEDLQHLADKISELHSVSYLRDKTVKDDSVQRHREQMNLLSRVSDSDITLSRDVQSSPAVLLNWMRGKTTPKVMHI